MINYIKILFLEDFKERNIAIDVDKLLIIENNNVKNITKKDIDELIDIIINWNEEYSNEMLIDSTEYTIEVISPDGIKKYHGKGALPDNFELFKSWVDKVC